MNTEEKLRKILQTKSSLKDAINNKGGNIGDDTPFDEYPTQINNISAGANTSDATATANDILLGKTAYTANGKVEGTIATYNGENIGGVEGGSSDGIVKLVEKVIIDTTQPIPTSGTFDYIVFNTALSETEVVDIIKNANLTFNDYLGVMSIYIVCSNESAGITLAILDAGTAFGETDAYAIIIMGTDEVVLFVTSNLKDSFSFSGWNTEVFAMLGGNVLPAGIEAESTAMGFPVGLQNEAIKHIINCGGGIVDTGEVQTVKELSGEYHLENHTFTPKSTTTYNILDLVGKKVETKKEGTLLVSNPDTLVEKIYFNTDLSVEEAANILSKLTYINNTDIYPAPFYIAYANADLSRCIAIVGISDMYVIAEGNFNTGDFIPIFTSVEEQGMIGWLIQNKEYQIGLTGLNFVDMLQLAIGDQNNKLTSLMSMNTDFEEVTTIKKVFPKEITIDSSLLEIKANEHAEASVINNILTYQELNLIKYPRGINYSDIPEYRFYNWKITGIEIPDTVNRIEKYAFYGCDKLTSVTIPNGVREIGEYAFSGCNFTQITLPNTLEEIRESAFVLGELGEMLQNVYYNGTLNDWVSNISFSNDGSTPLHNIRSNANVYMLDNNGNYYRPTDIEIIDTTYVSRYQFYGFKQLTSVKLPDTITIIGDGAFAYCGLTNINFPNSLIRIDNQAFDNCKLTNVVIPDGVTSIGASAFANNDSLTNIVLPNSLETIGDGAFASTAITSITIPPKVEKLSNHIFDSCRYLTNVVLHSRIYEIGREAFAWCNKLESIIIPSRVTTIDRGAFQYCSKLTDVYFTGTEEQWNSISISSTGNEYLTNATIHFNYQG